MWGYLDRAARPCGGICTNCISWVPAGHADSRTRYSYSVVLNLRFNEVYKGVSSQRYNGRPEKGPSASRGDSGAWRNTRVQRGAVPIPRTALPRQRERKRERWGRLIAQIYGRTRRGSPPVSRLNHHPRILSRRTLYVAALMRPDL